MVHFTVIAVLLAVIYIVVEIKEKPLLALFMKGLASLSFILLGVSSFVLVRDLPTYASWIIIGLACGMLGDVLLALRPLRPKEEDKKIIVFGIIAFSLGHIFYLIGLGSMNSLHITGFIVGVIALVFIVLSSLLMKFKMGIARYPSYFYAFLIFLMVGQTVYLSFTNGYASPYLPFMVGAILFGVSDLILAPIYYAGDKHKFMVVLNLVTYYAAQILIALSLYFF